MPLTRRDFAKRSAITGAGIALAGTVDVLATAPGALAADAPASRRPPPPPGTAASSATVSWSPTPTASSRSPRASRTGSSPVPASPRWRPASPPSNHDGTATFQGLRGATLLANNHELRGPRSGWPHPVPLTEGLVYDPAASGGVTIVEVAKHGSDVAEWVGVAGTSTNCAGGATPGVPG